MRCGSVCPTVRSPMLLRGRCFTERIRTTVIHLRFSHTNDPNFVAAPASIDRNVLFAFDKLIRGTVGPDYHQLSIVGLSIISLWPDRQSCDCTVPRQPAASRILPKRPRLCGPFLRRPPNLVSPNWTETLICQSERILVGSGSWLPFLRLLSQLSVGPRPAGRLSSP